METLESCPYTVLGHDSIVWCDETRDIAITGFTQVDLGIWTMSMFGS
jgi:hypothetical protein